MANQFSYASWIGPNDLPHRRFNNLTDQQIEELARLHVEEIFNNWFEQEYQGFPSRFDYHNKRNWDGQRTRADFEEICTTENLIKAIKLVIWMENSGRPYELWESLLDLEVLFRFTVNTEMKTSRRGRELGLVTTIQPSGLAFDWYPECEGDLELIKQRFIKSLENTPFHPTNPTQG